MLGVIALAGMDMRNSVILIDQISQDISHGLSEWEAVIESSVRRARPVILTAATAILAMIPLTRSIFWGPMAIAIMGGLSIATFLTLINLPAIYVLMFRVKPPESIQNSAGKQNAEKKSSSIDNENQVSLAKPSQLGSESGKSDVATPTGATQVAMIAPQGQ